MLIRLCLFLLTIQTPTLFSAETAFKNPAALLQTEINRIDTLIACTQKSLEEQQKVKGLIAEYKKIQERYLKSPQDNDLLLTMVKSAHRTLKAIQEYHLIQTFDPEFIEELTVMSLAAGKRGIPKP